VTVVRSSSVAVQSGNISTASREKLDAYNLASMSLSVMCTYMLYDEYLIMPPPNVMWPETYCFCSVRSFVRPSVRPETLLTQYIAHFTKLASAMHYGTEMNIHSLRSKVKVRVE